MNVIVYAYPPDVDPAEVTLPPEPTPAQAVKAEYVIVRRKECGSDTFEVLGWAGVPGSWHFERELESPKDMLDWILYINKAGQVTWIYLTK